MYRVACMIRSWPVLFSGRMLRLVFNRSCLSCLLSLSIKCYICTLQSLQSRLIFYIWWEVRSLKPRNRIKLQSARPVRPVTSQSATLSGFFYPFLCSSVLWCVVMCCYWYLLSQQLPPPAPRPSLPSVGVVRPVLTTWQASTPSPYQTLLATILLVTQISCQFFTRHSWLSEHFFQITFQFPSRHPDVTVITPGTVLASFAFLSPCWGKISDIQISREIGRTDITGVIIWKVYSTGESL